MISVEDLMPAMWALPTAYVAAVIWRARATRPPDAVPSHREGSWGFIMASAVALLLGVPLNTHLQGHHRWSDVLQHPQQGVVPHGVWLVLFSGGFLVALCCIAMKADHEARSEV